MSRLVLLAALVLSACGPAAVTSTDVRSLPPDRQREQPTNDPSQPYPPGAHREGEEPDAGP